MFIPYDFDEFVRMYVLAHCALCFFLYCAYSFVSLFIDCAIVLLYSYGTEFFYSRPSWRGGGRDRRVDNLNMKKKIKK